MATGDPLVPPISGGERAQNEPILRGFLDEIRGRLTALEASDASLRHSVFTLQARLNQLEERIRAFEHKPLTPP